MDHITSLRTSTAEFFDSVNFTELNDRWIDEVIDNEFTDASENDMTISILFVNDALTTLKKLAEICQKWCDIAMEDDLDESLNASTSSREDVLWTVLSEMDINVKHILGLVYLLCSRAKKKTSSPEEKIFGLASAKLYFNFLRVPGSGAYSVFHPNLFNLCIDGLTVPDFTSEKDSTSLREFEKLSNVYISTLISLIPLLKSFHLGNDSSAVEHVIKKLAELTSCEVQNPIKFENNLANIEMKELRRRYKPTFVVSLLSYQALLAIIETNLNGDKDQNYTTILLHLNKHILCQKAKKSPTISHKLHIIKDNVLSFVCHNLETKDFCSEVTLTAIKRLCLGVSDKADFRSAVSSAVVNILFKLKIEHVAEMIQWILLLIDSADTKDRVFALEVLGFLLNNNVDADCSSLPDPLKVYLTEVPIIFAILTRCDDTSPVVRTRALTVLSQNMKCILEFLDKTKDQETFDTEVLEEINERDVDVNGNHRFFWYNLTSLRERLNEIASILRRRVEDNNVTARRAALLALENLMVFDVTYLNEENLKFFVFAAKDGNIVVRKQMIQSLSVILDVYRDNYLIQASWLKCVLPLVQDPENTVQAKAISIIEEQFLQKIFSSSEADRECSFSLLKLLSAGNFLSHQRYLQKSFKTWKAEKKLRPQVVVQLEKYMNTEWEECVWFYLSNFAAYCSLPSKVSQFCISQFEKFESNHSFPDHMFYLLKVLNHTMKNLLSDKLMVIKGSLSCSLDSFAVPVKLIPIYIDVLFKSHQQMETESEFLRFSSLLLLKCENLLADIKSKSSFPEPPSVLLLSKCFCIMKELCQLDSTKITQNVVSLLRTFTACDKPPSALEKVLTPTLKAHAFAALGKICLQDEIVAKELLPVYAQELLISKYDVIRNNLVIILIEMCKRYTSFADKYVPLICLCFKDRLYLIRYQTIVLLVNLLQEGYIKWRGPLFFCLLSTLNDKKEDIQELGRYSLSQLLQDKKKNLFSEHFVDSIFVFNSFAPPDNETIGQTVKDLDRFALIGECRREKRMLLYKFLLESMDVKERAYLVKSVCEILMNIAEAVYPLNETTECIIRDCFAILTCKEIRAFNVEQISEDIEEAVEKEFCKTELDTRKIVIIEPVVPVIVSLNNGITDPGSDLCHDIIMFLKELLQDFKDSLKDILAIDKILLKQLELELRNDAERERTEKRSDRDLRDKNRQVSSDHPENAPHQSCDLQGIKSMMNDVSNLLMPENEEGERRKGRRHTSSQQTTRSTRQHADAGPSCSNSSPPQQTYNVATSNPLEIMDMLRFASTPRLVLTAVKVPPTSSVFNISAIEKTNEPMILEDSDEDMV